MRPQAEIEAAARLAFAHDFILQQPQGYQTIIGDKGCLLSGGQQQRLSIARSLLKNAPILLLDEAMSALDSESEKQIQAALETLTTGRTVIAIAHRLSTILKANQIVVMELGEIKEIGTHRELFEKSGYYRRLYDLQFNHHQGRRRSPRGNGGAVGSARASSGPRPPIAFRFSMLKMSPVKLALLLAFLLAGAALPAPGQGEVNGTIKATVKILLDGSKVMVVVDPDQRTAEETVYGCRWKSAEEDHLPSR